MVFSKNLKKLKGFSKKSRFWFKSGLIALVIVALGTNIYIWQKFGFEKVLDNAVLYAGGGSILAIALLVGGLFLKTRK